MLSYLTVLITKFLKIVLQSVVRTVQKIQISVSVGCWINWSLSCYCLNSMTSLAVLLCFGLLFVPLWLCHWCCVRHGFGRHRPPCGRYGLLLGPLLFVAVIAVAVMVCGRHRRSPIIRPKICQIVLNALRYWRHFCSGAEITGHGAYDKLLLKLRLISFLTYLLTVRPKQEVVTVVKP